MKKSIKFYHQGYFYFTVKDIGRFRMISQKKIVMFQDNETSAMLVYQANPVDVFTLFLSKCFCPLQKICMRTLYIPQLN